MANEALLIYKKAGLSEESNWGQGTITAATKLLPLRDAGVVIGINPQQIVPNRLRGDRAGVKDRILGTIAPAMSLPIFGYPVGIGLKLLKAALGQVTSTETASFTVTAGVNDKINFTEDGGAEKTATLAPGTYKIGTAGTEAGTLCKEVKDKLEVANDTAHTYTVTFSTSTKKMTVAIDSGVFVLKFATGANAATSARDLLGFGSVDTASGASVTAATAVEIVYSHAFAIKEAMDYGLTKGLTAQIGLASGKVFDVLDCVVNNLSIAYAPNQELWFDAGIEARRVEASAADLAALTDPTVKPLVFHQLAFTINAVAANIASLAVQFGNNYKTDLFVNSRYRSKFVRNGYRAVSGSFAFDITDADTYSKYDSFMSDSNGVPLLATFTGPTIKGALKHKIAISLPLAKPNFEAVPGGGGAAVPAGEVPFVAMDDGSTGELAITVDNNEAGV